MTDRARSPNAHPSQKSSQEKTLWRGSPQWQGIALRAFHLRGLIIYSTILVVWRIAANLYDGASFASSVVAGLWLSLFLGLALGLLVLFAWLSSRSTVYTITNRRLILQTGVALPMTITIPFELVVAANLKLFGNATGDIPLELNEKARASYIAMWPHVRSWRLNKPQPMLRAIPDAATVAEVLADALAATTQASASMGLEQSVEPRADHGTAQPLTAASAI